MISPPPANETRPRPLGRAAPGPARRGHAIVRAGLVALAAARGLAPAAASAQTPSPPAPSAGASPAPVALEAAPALAARAAFAEQLLRERDYFRGISVYKELRFYDENPAARLVYTYQIGRAYRLSRHYELAVEAFAPLFRRPEAPAGLVARAHLHAGVSQLALHAPALASHHLREAEARGERARPRLFFGVLALQSERYDDAGRAFSAAAAAPDADPGLRRLAGELGRVAAGAPDLPRRSPALAAALSALLPGAGQLYAGHPVDAAQALGFVGAFGFSTFLAYRYDHDRGGPYVFTGVSAALTALFYAANVLGAERSARYFNQRQKERLVEGPLRRAIAFEF